jgi:DNA-binding MarR family transcriptional regulator
MIYNAFVSAMRIYTGKGYIFEMEEKSTEALKYIKQNPGCKVSDVQRYLNVSRPVIATIIKSLEELGFVEKKQGKGRATALFVTQKGEEILAPKIAAAEGPATISAPSPLESQAAQISADPPSAPQAQATSPSQPTSPTTIGDGANQVSSPQQTTQQDSGAQKKKGFFARLRALF